MTGVSKNVGDGIPKGTERRVAKQCIPVLLHWVRSLFRIFPLALVILYCLSGATSTRAQSWPNGYGNRRTITIDHTKIPNTDQINFPLLISGTYSYLATTSNGGDVTSSSGYDIIFTSDPDGVAVLPFEQESYSATTGAVNYWIQVPRVSHATDTVIYMFYGNSAVTTDQSASTAVWDINYIGVWHLPNGTSLSGADSTSHALNLTDSGATATSGLVDGAAAFNGSASLSYLVDFYYGYPSLTVSAWVYSANFNQTGTIAYSDWSFYFGSGQLNFLDSYSGQTVSTLGLPSNSAWHYVVATNSGNSSTIYVDGIAQTQGASPGSSGGSFGSSTFAVGVTSVPFAQDYFTGTIDEFRLSAIARSADWIAAEYNNQSSPATFLSLGGVDPLNPPIVTTLTPSFGGVGTTVTIAGSNFGATQGSSTVMFDGITATPTTWSATSIVVPVPSGAASGTVVATVSGTASNGVWFTVPSTWANHYGYRRVITIAHEKVPNSDQINFPVLISGTYSDVATTGNGGDVTNSNGYDIIFTSDPAGSDILPFEQESYSPTTGAVNYWVEIPTLSHTTDTVIYMFYGNSAVTTDQSNKTGVWDTDYLGVWHLPNGTTLSATDSTSYQNNGTIQAGASATTGEIDGAGSFNGSSGYISTTNASNWPFTFTSEAWINTTSTAGNKVSSWETSQTGTGSVGYDGLLYVNTSGQPVGGCWSGTTTTVSSASPVNDGNWHHLVYTLNTSTNEMDLYVDGAFQGIVNCTNTGGGQVYFRIGSYKLSGWPNGNDGYFNGKIDEVRISDISRSADWIATEYNNQSSPSTFVLTGAANPPAITSLSSISGPVGTSITVSGSFFGSTQGSSTVTFDGTAATPTSWGNTSIVVAVPTGATSGDVVVTVAGVPSNGVWFTVPASTTYGAGFSNFQRITIDHAKVPHTDQIDFPVLISGTYSYLATTANGGNVASPGGYDIIFTSDAAGVNILPFEQESYNAATGAVKYWVQIPKLSHSTDTVIYMFYGNSAITTDQSNKNGVWDDNYVAVWHLPNGTTLSGADSTSSGYDLAINQATATSGEIDGGAAFNGSSSYLELSSFNLGAATFTGQLAGPSLTIGAWVYSTNFNQNGVIVNKEPSGQNFSFYFYGGQLALTGGGYSPTIYSGLPSNSAWHYLVGTVSGLSLMGVIYIDGVPQTAGPVMVQSIVDSLNVGRYGDYGGGDYFNGVMDEVRISNVARSADWIATEYNNQSSPSSFFNVGGVEPPTIAKLSPSSGDVGTSVTITGTLFGATQGSSTVSFAGTSASPASWSDTSIVVPVPSGAVSGSVVVTVGGVTSNAVSFTVPGTSLNNYAYQRAIVISHAKVPNTDQIDFPVLVSGTFPYLATTSNGGDVTNANGFDIIFTLDAAGTNILPFEQESYDGSTGAVNYWVQVPRLSHSVDTVIYMFYGNSAVTTDQSDKNGVWDINYQGVWHLPNGTTLSASDSTQNESNNIIQGGVTAAAGKIDGAASFNGSSGYLADTNGTYWPITATTEAWINTTSTAGTKVTGFETSQTGTGSSAFDGSLYVNTSGNAVAGCWNGSTTTITSRSVVNDGNWHHLVYVLNIWTNELSLYVDGSLEATVNCQDSAVWGGTWFRIGSYKLSGWPGGNDGYFSGKIDEVRFSNIARSGDWIATEYNNQGSMSTFLAVGGPNSPIITSLSSTSGPVGTSITISGALFGSTQGTSTVTFDGTTASPTSWSATSIVVPVPTGAASGNVVVTVSGLSSNAVWFTVPGSSANGYRFSRSITINHTKVPNTDQTNFPILISGTYPYLANVSYGGSVTNSAGYDIVFTSDPAGTSVLPFEQESYNAMTGAVDYWVKVSTLSHSTDTVIYMFYGNSAITTDQSNKNGVWDSNYAGIWHLPNGTTLTASDSTSYANAGTIQGTVTATAGEIDGAGSFDGSSGYISTATAGYWPFPVTMEAWVNTTSTSGNKVVGLESSQTGTGSSAYEPEIYVDTNGKAAVACYTGGIASIASGSIVNDGNWHDLVLTMDTSAYTMTLYVDGASQGTASCSGTSSYPYSPAYLRIGSYKLAGAPNGNDGYFNGEIDEVRISAIVRSADWIATQYNNQYSPSTFYNVSSLSTLGGPVISSVSPTSGGATAAVTISGAGFGSTQGTSTVQFNTTTASVTSWGSTSITTSVPSGATTGNIIVIVSGMPSNPVAFTVTGGLSGAVTSGGVGINGATVEVLQNGTTIATTTSSSSGSYSVSGLGTGEYDVKFSASGYGTVLQSSVTIPASGLTLNQALGTAGTISGQVTQTGGSTAISGAAVTVLQNGETVGTATTNGSGNYSVSTLAAGSYDVDVAASGYVTQDSPGVSVTSGTTTTENFSLNAVGTQPISYVYDPVGRLIAAIDQGGNAAVYAYDAVGNILSISRGSAQQLSVLAFSPASGAVGSTVTIYGTSFSTTLSSNTVKFNGTTATVTAATVTSLVVTVPTGATSGTISVTTSGGTATSSASFSVTAAGAGQPTISSFTPTIGTAGTSVSVTGTNFDTVTANDKVKFNEGTAFTSSGTTTSLSVSVPNVWTSGHLVVTTPAGTGTSSSDFFVVPSGSTVSQVGYTNRMSLGGNLTVTLSTAGQFGIIVFDGTVGHSLSLLTSSNTMTSSGGATTFYIWAPNNTFLTSPVLTTSAPFMTPVLLPVTGTYTVFVVPSSSATGSINMALYDVPAGVTGPITIGGSTVTVNLTTPGQGGALTFSGTSGQSITVHATSNSISNVSIAVFAPDGTIIGSQTSSSSSFNLSGVSLPSTGTYTLGVAAFLGNTGSITFQLTSP